MYLPIFHQIEINKYDLEFITKSLKSFPLGRVPLIIKLEKIENEEECIKSIQLIEQYLMDEDIHPYFPYPIYIKSNLETKIKSNYCILDKFDEVPTFFKVRKQLPSHKDKALLKNIEIENLKLINEDLPILKKELKKLTQEHRELISLARELEYYRLLYKKLQENLNE